MSGHPLTAALALVAALGLAAAAPAPRTVDDYVRVTLDTPAPSPFSLIRYEVTAREPATTAVHRRLLPGHDESLHALGLLTEDEAAAIFALVDATGAMELRDAAPAQPPPSTLAWRVELRVGGREHSFRVVGPEQLRDRRYQRLVDGVRAAVLRHAGDLPFRNVFFEPDARGWLNVVSVPRARLWIDDFDTRLDTPIYHYELPSGAHTVRLRAMDGDYDRTYEVRVEPGGTTSLRVDLR